MENYTIIETNSGLWISDSRVTVYDVLELYRNGDSIYEISGVYNLNPVQVIVAVEYIEQHRERLERELDAILVRKAERHRHYREIADEIDKKIERKKHARGEKTFQELLTERRGQRNGTAYSQ